MCDDFCCLLPVGRTKDDDNGDGVTLTRMGTFFPCQLQKLAAHTKLRKDEGNYHKNNQERKSLFGANLFLSYFFFLPCLCRWSLEDIHGRTDG